VIDSLIEISVANIILWFGALFFLIQLLFILLIFFRITVKGKRELASNEGKPVTVIVCARNEEQNLVNFVPKILEQDYERFELLLINDRSWDETWDVMEALAAKDERIKLVNIPDAGKDGYAKKFALTIGIKAAKYDQLLFIDADCYPSSKNWLSKMAGQFSTEKKIVLGVGAYEKDKGFVNKAVRFETCNIALTYLSFAKAGVPYMGVGRNLAYKNELYDSIRGFKNHYHVKSGDDDLFVNEAATKNNTTICLDPEATTFSIPEKNFKDWFRQKRRHLTTGHFYRGYHKLLLGLWPLSYLLMLVCLIIASALHPLFWVPLCVIAMRWVLAYIVSWRVFNTMQSKDVWFLYPFMELFIIFLNAILLLTNKKYNQHY